MNSGSSDNSNKQTPLDRTALERVLSRAAELQHSNTESLELYSEDQLVDLGREVGLSSAHIRQAIAEERTRPPAPAESGATAEYFGPSRVEARRVVRASTSVVLQRLERWMENDESLQVKRRFPDRVTWEARRDFLGSVKRGFNVGGRGYALASAQEVGATVTPVDDASVLVLLSADYVPNRRNAVTGAAVTAGLFTTSSAGLFTLALALGGPVLIAGGACLALTAMGGGIAVAIARSNRELTGRGQLSLEQALDRIEQKETPTSSVLTTLLDAAVRELK